MAISWMDNFNSYGLDETFLDDGLYTTNLFTTLHADPDPGTTGNCIESNSIVTNDGYIECLRKTIATGSQTTCGVGARFWPLGLPAGLGDSPVFFYLADVSNSRIAYLYMTPTGALSLVHGTTTSTTTLPVIVPNAWQHIEIKYIANTSIEVRVESVTVLNVNTDIPSAPVGITSYGALWNSNVAGFPPNTYMKDLIVWDGSGTSNTDFQGSVIITDVLPVSDVSFNWTPSTGSTGWNLLDNAPPLDGTEYISAIDSPIPAASIFSLSDLPENVAAVRGLMTIIRAKKADGGDGNLQVSMISNGDTGNGANRPITAGWTYWYDMFPLDPDTGSAWTPSSVNAATIKINRTV